MARYGGVYGALPYRELEADLSETKGKTTMANYHREMNQKKVSQAAERQNEERRKAIELEKNKIEEAAKEKAKINAEHRFQVMLVLITAATTLLVEHFIEILHFFCEFFQG